MPCGMCHNTLVRFLQSPSILGLITLQFSSRQHSLVLISPALFSSQHVRLVCNSPSLFSWQHLRLVRNSPTLFSSQHLRLVRNSPSLFSLQLSITLQFATRHHSIVHRSMKTVKSYYNIFCLQDLLTLSHNSNQAKIEAIVCYLMM